MSGLAAWPTVASASPRSTWECTARVIPFMTYDTMQLLDPERRAAHEALVKAWGDKCTFLGRYDYTYGDDHVPPRIYLHHWAKYVPLGAGPQGQGLVCGDLPLLRRSAQVLRDATNLVEP